MATADSTPSPAATLPRAEFGGDSSLGPSRPSPGLWIGEGENWRSRPEIPVFPSKSSRLVLLPQCLHTRPVHEDIAGVRAAEAPYQPLAQLHDLRFGQLQRLSPSVCQIERGLQVDQV